MDKLGKLEKVVHIKTNVGLSMTTKFVEDYCKEMGWPLQIIEPQPKFVYASFVLQYGFPGPNFHSMIMGYLKFHAMRNYILGLDKNKDCCYVSGIRKFESKRRMANFPEPIGTQSSMFFCSPFFYRKDEEIYADYIKGGLKKSPAYDLGWNGSGECLCGSFAVKGDKKRMADVEPKLARYIKWLEDGIQEFGTDAAKRYPTWGGSSAMKDIEQQEQLDEFLKDPLMKSINESEGFICGQECGPGTLRGETDFL